MSLLEKILQKKQEDEYFLTLGVEQHRFLATIAKISDNKVIILGTGESEWTSLEQELEAADSAITLAEKYVPETILVEKTIFALPVEFLEGDTISQDCLNRLKKIAKEFSLKPSGFIEYSQALAYFLEDKEESPPTALLLSIGKSFLSLTLVRVGKIERNINIPRTPSIPSDFEQALTHCKEEILPSRIILYNETKDQSLEKYQEELLGFSWHKHTSFLHTPKIEILPNASLLAAIVEAAGTSMIKTLHLEEHEEETVTTEETFGFVRGVDVKQTSPAEETLPVQAAGKETIDNIQEVEVKKPWKEWLGKIPVPHISLPAKISLTVFPFVAIIGTVAVISSLVFLFVWSYPKATVNLIVYPYVVTKRSDVLFTTNPNRQQTGKNTVTATLISEEVTGDKTVQTTGKTKVGEHAKGDVVILNKTLGSKTFTKGTQLLNGSLVFTLDQDVTVASASDTGEGLTFGKISTTMTASDIGSESNLASGSIFTLKDFPQSSFTAKNSQNFTGGSSRDVPSVSKSDQDTLLSSLTDELSSKARQQLLQKLSPTDILLDGSIDEKVTTKKLSKEVGSEAKEVNLSMVMQVSALSVKQSDLTDLAKDAAVGVPPGFTLDNQRSKVDIAEPKTDKNGDVKATATISLYLFPTLETAKVKEKIAGKTFDETRGYVAGMDHVAGVEIIQNNSLPLLRERLPLQKSRIEVNIEPRS